ncbi:MAG: hypothetical protein CVU97_01265 [Firmicutes bacterium HGW-Firmicutes-21]|nr:MAG: hypothetical protein CVU97_01265 [Firmicutes bacterium HGW-Firmicutes-21]
MKNNDNNTTKKTIKRIDPSSSGDTSVMPNRQPMNRPPQKSFKRKQSPIRKQRIIAVLILLLTLYIVISLLIAGFIYFSFNKVSNNTQLYSLQLKYDGKRVHSFETTEVNNSYGLYVPFGKLSEICELSIVGDSETVIIIIRPNGGSIVCKNNSSLVYINDNSVRLSSPILFGSDDYLIPVELVKTYMIGIDITYDDDNMICVISRNADDENITLKMLLPTELDKTYFPDSYKNP